MPPYLKEFSMNIEDATVFTEKCYMGEPASCSWACPFGLDVRGFLEKVEKGRWQAAFKALRNAAVFPSVVSALCTEPCRNHCQRTQIGDDPIDVRRIEEACIRNSKNRKPDVYVLPPKNESVAVIGAGAAGLSCALSLAQIKYNVTVFEKEAGWGGALRSRARFNEFDDEFTMLFSATDTEFVFGAEIKSLGELSVFNAVYIATGASGENFGLLESFNGDLLTTADPKVFLGGRLTGADTMHGIAQCKKASKSIETFLQTGKTLETYGNTSANSPRYLDHAGAENIPLVKPASPEGYTGEEAIAEAGRCLKCDCDKCMVSCEMLDSFRKNPKKIAMEVYSDHKAIPPYSSHTLTRQTYSCNMCGHCKAVCSEEIDIGSLLKMSRETRLESGNYPDALHDYWLREMDFSIGEASFSAPPKNPGNLAYVFFPGCQLGAHNPEHVLRSYDFLHENYGAGVYTGCCGAPAYWAGDKVRFNKNLETIRATWRELGEPTFIFACATCKSIFKTALPEIKQVSLYEMLANDMDSAPDRLYDSASVFDPCNSRGETDMENAVRALVGKSGAQLFELDDKNRCCGYGGHIREANPKLYDTVTDARTALGQMPYIVYCANCKEVFVSHGKECAHILDMVFKVPQSKNPAIHEKRQNALTVKKELMKKRLNEDFEPIKHDWDGIELVVADDLLAAIDKKLISIIDIKEAVWLAETSGDKFIDEQSGTCLCSMEKPVLTYWVNYKKTGGAFEVLNAYYHRMKFSKEDA